MGLGFNTNNSRPRQTINKDIFICISSQFFYFSNILSQENTKRSAPSLWWGLNQEKKWESGKRFSNTEERWRKFFRMTVKRVAQDEKSNRSWWRKRQRYLQKLLQYNQEIMTGIFFFNLNAIIVLSVAKLWILCRHYSPNREFWKRGKNWSFPMKLSCISKLSTQTEKSRSNSKILHAVA